MTGGLRDGAVVGLQAATLTSIGIGGREVRDLSSAAGEDHKELLAREARFEETRHVFVRLALGRTCLFFNYTSYQNVLNILVK